MLLTSLFETSYPVSGARQMRETPQLLHPHHEHKEQEQWWYWITDHAWIVKNIDWQLMMGQEKFVAPCSKRQKRLTFLGMVWLYPAIEIIDRTSAQ